MITATVISLCLGGSVKEYHYRAISGEAFEIRGYAASACTMFLGADDVCVSRNSTLVFHRPSKGLFRRPLTDSEILEWGRFIAAHYPEDLRNMYMEEVISKGNVVTLRGSEVIDKYGVEECRKKG